MRWEGQRLDAQSSDALPGLARLNNLVRTVRTPEFAGMTFYEVLAKSALNKVPGSVPGTPSGWDGDLGRLADALRAGGFTEREVAGVLAGNALRVLREAERRGPGSPEASSA